MSKIFNLIRDGKLMIWQSDSLDEAVQTAKVYELTTRLISKTNCNCIPIDAQSAFDDVDIRIDTKGALSIPVICGQFVCALPPFGNFWLEGSTPIRKIGFHVLSDVTHYDYVGMRVSCWLEHEGSAFIDSTLYIKVDHAGKFLTFDHIILGPRDTADAGILETACKIGRGWVVYILHTLCKINCSNCTLVEVPIYKKNGKSARSSTRTHPYSVWRTIRVECTIKNKSADPCESIEPTPKRLHFVRGHYADYRAGRGLFGRLRGVFWFSEQIRGDASMGTVKQQYVVG